MWRPLWNQRTGSSKEWRKLDLKVLHRSIKSNIKILFTSQIISLYTLSWKIINAADRYRIEFNDLMKSGLFTFAAKDLISFLYMIAT